MELQNQIKKCERCGIEFECKPLQITECQCSNIQLSEKSQRFIQTNYKDCLCKNCLEEIKHLNSN